MRKLSGCLTGAYFAVLACVVVSLAAHAADESALTKDQIKQFLQTAEVIKNQPSSKGITHPWRLTLSNGTITHDASFQAVDEHKAENKLASGRVELNFVDSYKYNIAAYQIAELLAMKPTGKKCEGMEGVIKEGAEALAEQGEAPVLDLGLIGAGSRVEHYEMAGYMTAISLAQRLGSTQIVSLLKQSLAEEEAAEQKLRKIASVLLKTASTAQAS